SQVSQRLERPQRVRIEFPSVVYSRQSGSFDEIVREDLVPEVNDRSRFREEAMTADVEQKSVVRNRPADAADILVVLLEDEHLLADLAEQIRGRQPGGAGTDDDGVE